MQRRTIHIGVLVLAIGFSIALVHTSPTSWGQSKKIGKSAAVDAAATNAQLRTNLNWMFGGKPQHGWYIYTPLIKRLIDTKHDPASPKFASAVAHWQLKSGLKPSGVLDDETLYAMIKAWQEARLKDRSVAQPDQLLLAPISDFYDPTRAEELRQVERKTYTAYKRLIAAAISERSLGLAHTSRSELAPGEKYLKIISAFRSREYQEKLRRESPNSGTAGLAVNSPHFTGRALDLYVGGEPVDTLDPNRAFQVSTPVYQWLVRNAERFGFRPYCYEPWHWEYVR
ncbi:MAG: D-alanyl-D-alanine carboxypeptidase family protein [Pyrinomonadaceae bacterium]